MRLAFVLVVGAVATIVGGFGRVARADTEADVTVLTPAPVAPIGNPAPPIGMPPDLRAFTGAPILAVDVLVEDATRWDVRTPTLGVMKPGDLLSAPLVRDALAEILATGFFADARAEITPDAGGVKVTIRVAPRKVIHAIRLDLHGAPVDGDGLLRDADLANDGEILARDIPVHTARIEALLMRRGFPAPQVVLTTRGTDDPLRVVVMLDVSVGAPRKIERRVLYPSAATKEEIEDAERFYVAKAGDRADETVLDAADAALEARIRARGHHQAEVHHDVVLHRGLIVLRVRADFGTRYDTRYEGNDHFDKGTLDGVLDLEAETDRTPNHLMQKIHDFYVKRGFLDVDVRLEHRGTRSDALNYLVFVVDEGTRVSVAARSYPCMREEDVKKLSEGGPTSARAVGSEIDSFLDEELPGNDVLVPPRVAGLDKTIAGSLGVTGARPSPLELDPETVYVPETYERAIQHVQELYRSEGFLSAQVGPVQVVRRRCDPRSPPGECRPVPAPAETAEVCTYDAIGLPLAVPPLEQGSTCVSDRAHGITCEPRVWLRIPVKLGPRTQLWDVGFAGAERIAPAELARAADVKLGDYASGLKLDEARRRVDGAYREEGYAFVDTKYSLEQSPDHTRARVRFNVTEGEKVLVRDIVIQGNVFTKTTAIKKRIALEVGQPYRASLVRKTEERIATLGAFSSVTVALDNPYVPQRNKTVVITVVERPRQYIDQRVGFSTGEGFRISGEYGHNNLWGNAVQLVLRLQLAYIPTPFIIDPVARDNYRALNDFARLGMRATASIVFPEIGLGPLVRTGMDAVLVHDLQRDFYLTKLALIPNINYRPVSELQFTFFQSFEFNNSRIFQEGNIDDYLQSRLREGLPITDLSRQLLVPDGETYAFSQRLLATWDRRDNAFNASRGTYVSSGVEHVDAYPTEVNLASARDRGEAAPPESHFFKLTQTFGAYLPLPKGMRVAFLTRVGANVQITPDSVTYPDRLFFMGGVDSMRGWNFNSFIPQDDIDRIYAGKDLPDSVPDTANPGQLVPNPQKFTANTRPIRGGNLMANERVEIRIPIKGPFETVVFSDIGNLWINPEYPFRRGKFPIRAAVGTGLRVQTPVGPLAVDYGINVTREDYEDFGAINFAIGLF